MTCDSGARSKSNKSRQPAAFVVCKSGEARLQHYIARQATHHRRHTFEDELIALLHKHEIPYDRRYLFD